MPALGLGAGEPFRAGGRGRGEFPPPEGLVTLDIARRSPRVALSPDSMTATGSGLGDGGMVLATVGRSSGKRYFEMQVGLVGGSLEPTIGVATANASLVNQVGGDGESWGLLQSGEFQHNSITTATAGGSILNTDVVQVAVDLTLGRVWFGKNGVWLNSGNPTAGTGASYSNLSGTIFPSVSLGALGIVTARFSATTFTLPVPTGFLAWAVP